MTDDAGADLPERAPLPGGADASFDRYARLVRTQLGVPTALVSLVTLDGQAFPGALGLPLPWQEERSTPLTHSVCQHVVRTRAAFACEDVRELPELPGSLATDDLGVVAYAGHPLRDADGVVVGSLCAVDGVPRRWSEDDLQVLADLAGSCSSEIALRQLRERADAALRASEGSRRLADAAERRSRLLLALSEGLARTSTADDVVRAVAPLAREELGAASAHLHVLAGTRQRLLAVEPDADPSDPPLERRVDARDAVGAAVRGRATVVAEDRTALLAEHPATDLGAGAGDGTAVVVPLQVAGRVLGALALTWTGSGRPDAAALGVVTATAGYVGQAVARAQLLAEQRSTATLLQEAMLTELPQPDHLQLVARYVPAARDAEVGGDWYDALVTPDGATHVVIGDVVGHDMRAAAAMGQLRSLLRTMVWAQQESPSHVLSRVDEAMRGLHVSCLATCVLARVEQDPDDAAAGVRRLRWSSAGHLPPLLLGPDGTAHQLPGSGDLLLGVRTGTPRHDHEAVLEPGSTLLLSTDGLVERRDRSLLDGVDALRRSLERHGGLPLDQLADALLDDLVGGHGEDDVALLALRAHPEDRPRPAEAGPGHL
ncbi:GAF domain-containing SpoIIE family protein phosphatase [uncultured Pseudokineococcus sp.]|uniref:GAF domain-containing SpoIIE family protein phosphatase n=1 Tax=uncultured Pseudokineococcus sp. TaxID=1642928 RepID=UPI002637B3AF|nr:SpoIIE family protein phosphatase [uncultured Pseudokineococcus sp.]